MRPLTLADLPLCLPELADYQPSGRPEPPLGKATDWVNVTLDGNATNGKPTQCRSGLGHAGISNTYG